jgi:hypothetical protein
MMGGSAGFVRAGAPMFVGNATSRTKGSSEDPPLRPLTPGET